VDASQPLPTYASPWTQRLVETGRWSPFRLSCAIAAGLLVAFSSVEVALGRFPQVLSEGSAYAGGDVRLAIAMILLVSYLPSASALVVSGTRRAVAELGPVLRASAEEREALTARAGCFDAASLRRAGLQGACLLLLVPLLTNLTPATYAFWRLGPEAVIHRMLLPLLGWFAGRFVFALIVESRRLSQLGRFRVEVDLLDLRPLYPLVRQGLRQSLLAAVLIGLVALCFLGGSRLAPGLYPVVTGGLVVCSLMTGAALALPLRGAHAAIVAAKSQELAWCNEAIHRARAAITGRTAADEEEPAERKLADLVAYRGLVDGVSEWPFDAPAIVRSIAYLAIPLGGWLGGALVDRLVSALVP
jgi:hypothetical protein